MLQLSTSLPLQCPVIRSTHTPYFTRLHPESPYLRLKSRFHP
ncbi:hypothetical protein HanXRQr2_Chr17g0810721 [Helianthus annuus]|uniref:Uncharacterized protein n=1 Tax=Helianthus annuus TaxID=4232 RepID=A0A9K3DIV7_HELAN|nr:hypothetical protein HanXRQr2_Chr17g0810721 [Helianthus annuus]